MEAMARMTHAAMIVAAAVFLVAGCGGERADQPPKQKEPQTVVSGDKDKTSVSAEKIAALEKDVAKLRAEVRQLRQRIEMDARMRSRHGMPPYPRQPGVGGPDGSSDGELRPRRFTRRDASSAMRQDPATMTPEQRRAWHEERLRMREERRQKIPEGREKISEHGKPTSQNNKDNKKEESK